MDEWRGAKSCASVTFDATELIIAGIFTRDLTSDAAYKWATAPRSLIYLLFFFR